MQKQEKKKLLELISTLETALRWTSTNSKVSQKYLDLARIKAQEIRTNLQAMNPILEPEKTTH